MTTPTTETVNTLAWEGAAGVRTVAILAVVLAVTAGWLLWRERHALGRGWAAAIWALRAVAFGCALWMLAGPTQLRIQRTIMPQSLAVFADCSESMDVVDPPDPVELPRWALACDAQNADKPLVQCDRLDLALGAAIARCTTLAQGVADHLPPSRLDQESASLAKLAERASRLADDVVELLHSRDESLARRGAQIAATLDERVIPTVEDIRATLTGSARLDAEALSVPLEQIQDDLVTSRRRARLLAVDLAPVETHSLADGQTEFSELSRRAKAGRVLDLFESAMRSELADNVRVRRFRFDQRTAAVDARDGWSGALELPAAAPSADDASYGSTDRPAVASTTTNLSAVLEQLTADRTSEGTRLAVVLSDGRHNDLDARQPQDVAAQLAGVPLYFVAIGNALQVRDALLHRVEAPSAVAEHDSALIDVIITGFDCDGQSSEVVLHSNGKEVDRQKFAFAGNRADFRARFTVRAEELGWQEYVVEVEPVADETNTSNNYMPVSFEVVRNKTRVLLADGAPRWEFRYLSQLFRRDPHIEFDELLFFPRVHGTGALAERPEFPRTVDEWARYDVVILGDVGPQQLPQASQKSLQEYVDARRGNVILIAGQSAMPHGFAGQPLMELLPVDSNPRVLPNQGFLVLPTEEGRLHSALAITDSPEESRRTWRSIYERFPVFGLSEYSSPKRTAHTLLEAAPDSGDDWRQALLCWHRVGAGRVAYLAAPDTYRLRWRHGDRMHHRFWGQFLRWMTAANAGTGLDLVRLQTDRTRYSSGQPVEVTAWLKEGDGRPLAGESIRAVARNFNDETAAVELTPDPAAPGRYSGRFENLEDGAYQIALSGAIIDQLAPAKSGAPQVQTTIAVQSADNIEMINTQSNRALLAQVAQITGGQVIPPTALGELLEMVSFTPEVKEQVDRAPLWNRWSSLFIVLGCVLTEWIVRKSKGLA